MLLKLPEKPVQSIFLQNILFQKVAAHRADMGELFAKKRHHLRLGELAQPPCRLHKGFAFRTFRQNVDNIV